MVKLRLKRMGRRNLPFYRIVAVDARKKRDGAYLEAMGHYDPQNDKDGLKIDSNIVLKWLNYGAKATDTVKSLFRKKGILQKWHEQKKEKKEIK